MYTRLIFQDREGALQTKNQLSMLPGSAIKVGGWVLKANLVLRFGPNHELGFIVKLGPSWTIEVGVIEANLGLHRTKYILEYNKK